MWNVYLNQCVYFNLKNHLPDTERCCKTCCYPLVPHLHEHILCTLVIPKNQRQPDKTIPSHHIWHWEENGQLHFLEQEKLPITHSLEYVILPTTSSLKTTSFGYNFWQSHCTLAAEVFTIFMPDSKGLLLHVN